MKRMSVRAMMLAMALAAAPAGAAVPALGEETSAEAASSEAALVDFSSLSNEEFLLLFDQVQQEAVSRQVKKSASLPRGHYTGGADLPAGKYIITKESGTADSGIIWLRAVNDPENDYPSKLYEFLSKDEADSFYVSIDEGDVLETPFPITLTISPGVVFE